jgi:hypothetical protein
LVLLVAGQDQLAALELPGGADFPIPAVAEVEEVEVLEMAAQAAPAS